MIVAGPLIKVSETGKPDVAVALGTNGASPYVLSGMAGKFIVCGIELAVNEITFEAGLSPQRLKYLTL